MNRSHSLNSVVNARQGTGAVDGGGAAENSAARADNATREIVEVSAASAPAGNDSRRSLNPPMTRSGP